MAICDRCATENPSDSRFCGACGAPLSGAGEHHARKIVTALFCDVADSTALGEQLDPEALNHVLGSYFEAISATIERHGGTVQKFAGDAVLAVFGIPRVHEDDALRAVRAAVEIGERLSSVADKVGVALRFRTGLNTGLVITDDRKNLAMGDAVNVAARLEQAAQPGEILLGSDTLDLVRDAVEVERLEPLTLKGKSQPVPAFRLLRVDPVAPGLARRLDSPLVDRERELRILGEIWDRTLQESSCQLVTLLGVAGVGKSRLVEELLARLDGAATTLRGRCLHYGEGITFWPIVEALADVGEAAEPVLEHLSSGGAATPEELFWEVRRLLETLALQRPVILHIDDLHWAEPMLVDLLEHIVGLSRDAPILVLCTARPELLEEHDRWGASRLNSTTVELEPLGNADCVQLLDQLGDELSPEVRARVIATSEGNPLFLEEMVVLARERGTVDVPPTIQALLGARLERLEPDELELLARCAIEGQVFHRSAVCALLSKGSALQVDSQLAGLVRKDLIRPHPGNVPGDDAFGFRHLLIRDAAYARLPKARRADLHERYAGWLEDTAVDFAELDEIAGWHLEQAVRHERELDREAGPGLTRHAAERLSAAGRRASDRSDVVAARNLLERALAMAPDGDPLRSEIGVELAERLIEVGDLVRADELLAAAERDLDGTGTTRLIRLEWLLQSQPAEATQTIESLFPQMLDELARTQDDRGLAKAHMLAFWVQWAASRATLAAEQVRLAAEHARKAGDIGRRSRALGWYVATLIYGPRDADAIAHELDAIDREDPGPYLAAFVGLGRGEVERLKGRFDEARELTQGALEGFRQMGIRTMAATCDQSLASIELSKGDAAAALGLLQRSDAILAEFGERPMRSTTQAMLARAHERNGGGGAARAAATLAEELSAPQDVANFVITHGVRARLALADGALDTAERWARSALGHSLQTDFVGLQAEAMLGLACVLSADGRSSEAMVQAEAGLDLLREKGDRPGSDAAQALIGTLGA
jgi:class 3 adenylate cyclase/tetratricopeptide (TPR) repeat protein